MKAEIFEIIMSEIFDKFHIQVTDYTNINNAVDEINAHVMEFIGWLREVDMFKLTSMGLYTNTEVYQYWLKNIKE